MSLYLPLVLHKYINNPLNNNNNNNQYKYIVYIQY